jgi:hypothetical protein
MRKIMFWAVVTALLLGSADILANSVFSGDAAGGRHLPPITNAL